jgi:hypothetical protein
MRALKAITIIMAVMIVVGTVTLAFLIVRRVSAVSPAPGREVAVGLDEPAGSAIAAIASAGPGEVALLLHGGGPDRVVVIDLASGRVRGRVSVSH